MSQAHDVAAELAARLPETIQQTLIVLETQGVALDSTLPGEPPRSADRLMSVVPLPLLDIGPDGELLLGERIGEGGMGEVYVAEQPALGRDVAVKLLRDALITDAGAAWLLVDEARITGALEHPNIVPIHALGRDGTDRPVMVMKRLAGLSWRDVMHASSDVARTLPAGAQDQFGWNLSTLMQVCNAVHFAHSRGVIHRDIKPENVMVGEHGEVYLLDWGAAYRPSDASHSNALVGTLAYMAPEMLQGTGPTITAQTDVYLLGASLFEVLTGRPPHAAADVQGALFSICTSELPAFPTWVPTELADLCRRSMRRDPAERPRSALEFKQAIEDYLTHRGSIEIGEAAKRRLSQLARRCAPQALKATIDDEQAVEVNRLFIECAFGFRQALETWTDNPGARAGLQEAFEHMIRFELGRHNPKAAAALLAQLPEPREELRQEVEALRRRLEGEGRELERLRSIAEQQDPTSASGARAASAVVTGVSLAVLFGWLSRAFPAAAGLSHRSITLVTLVIGVGLLAGTLLAREKVLGNHVNRYLTATMFAIVFTILGIHGTAMLSDAPLAFSFVADFFVAGAVTATVGFNIHRGMVYVGLAYVAGAVAAAAVPTHVLEVMAATFLLAHLLLAWTWRALARESSGAVGSQRGGR